MIWYKRWQLTKHNVTLGSYVGFGFLVTLKHTNVSSPYVYQADAKDEPLILAVPGYKLTYQLVD